jgi:hypothetical protein
MMIGRILNSKSVDIIPIDDILSLAELKDNQKTVLTDAFVQQVDIVKSRSIMMRVQEADRNIRFCTTRETLSIVIAFFFVVRFEKLIDAECREFMIKEFEKNPDIMPEKLFNLFIHVDSQKKIPFFYSYFMRQLACLKIAFPKLVIPDSFAKDLED